MQRLRLPLLIAAIFLLAIFWLPSCGSGDDIDTSDGDVTDGDESTDGDEEPPDGDFDTNEWEAQCENDPPYVDLYMPCQTQVCNKVAPPECWDCPFVPNPNDDGDECPLEEGVGYCDNGECIPTETTDGDADADFDTNDWTEQCDEIPPYVDLYVPCRTQVCTQIAPPECWDCPFEPNPLENGDECHTENGDGICEDGECVLPPIDPVVEIDGLRIIRLKGDGYTRGRVFGEQFGEIIVDFYQRYILDSWGSDYPDEVMLGRAIAEAAVDLTEDEWAMLRGIAETITETGATIVLPNGDEVPFGMGDIVAANGISDFAQFGCSSAVAWGDATEDGEAVVSRNLDWDPGPDFMIGPGTIVIAEESESGDWRNVSVAWPGMIGCYSCMNADGMAAFIHDAPRYASGIVATDLVPRTLLLRRALQSAAGAEDPFAAFEQTIEDSKVDTGNNFLLVTAATDSEQVAGCFETNADSEHEDGWATLRTADMHEQNGIDRDDVLLVTNHYRARYNTSSGGRYDSMRDGVAITLDPENPENPTNDAVIDLSDILWINRRANLSVTVYTTQIKPATKSLTVYTGSAERPTVEAPGVEVPWEVLFPW